MAAGIVLTGCVVDILLVGLRMSNVVISDSNLVDVISETTAVVVLGILLSSCVVVS